METPKKYHRLTAFEREEISLGLARRESMATIAGGLGRETSTICQEVARNKLESGYRAFSADNRAIERASSRHQGKSRIAR
jgi:IS30 family transposase